MEKDVIINLPGQVQDLVWDWIDKNDLFELTKAHNIAFVKWFVSNGSYKSIKLFIDSVELYEGKLKHVFVRNQGVSNEWEHLNANEDLKAVLALENVKAIDFPKLNYRDRDQIEQENELLKKDDQKKKNSSNQRVRIADAKTHKKFGVVARQRVVKFMRDAYKAFDETGLLPMSKAATQELTTRQTGEGKQ